MKHKTNIFEDKHVDLENLKFSPPSLEEIPQIATNAFVTMCN